MTGIMTPQKKRPPCGYCGGSGRVRGPRGGTYDCARCGGTGTKSL